MSSTSAPSARRRLRTLCLASLATTITALLAVAPAQADCPSVSFRNIVAPGTKTRGDRTITAQANSDPNLNGLLRATKEPWDSVTARERFDVVCHDGYANIRNVATNKYVAVEMGAGGSHKFMLRARTPGNALGLWEKFTIEPSYALPGAYLIRSQANNLYVAAEHDNGGQLAARTPGIEIGPWEKFWII
jgi:hypothetical protein